MTETIEYWLCVGEPDAVIDNLNHEYAIFTFPLLGNDEIALRMDAPVLQRVASCLSEVSSHFRARIASRDGHTNVQALEVSKVGAHKLVGGRAGVELRTDTGAAQIFALTADEAKWLAEQLLKLEPEVRAEAEATRQ